MAPKFEDNIILTKTERLMMSNRPPDPKNARNKNVLIVGGSGSGKTRFWLKPNLLQMHSSYVVTDPKGSIVVECGNALLKNGYKLKILNTINFSKSMKEIVPVIKDLLTKAIVENAIRKLEKIPEPECSQFVAATKARFLAERDNSIRQRLAAAKLQEPIMQGHDLSGKERFHPETRHMITLEVQKDCFVGFKGERFRFYLSDEGYRNAKHSEQEGEIKIKSHAAVVAGKLYPDKKRRQQER